MKPRKERGKLSRKAKILKRVFCKQKYDRCHIKDNTKNIRRMWRSRVACQEWNQMETIHWKIAEEEETGQTQGGSKKISNCQKKSNFLNKVVKTCRLNYS